MRSPRIVLMCVTMLLTGCASWVNGPDGLAPMSMSHITKDDLQRYVLTKDDIVNAPVALKSSPNEFDWPLMIALWKESGRESGEDCRLKDAFRCLRNAAIHRQLAYAYRTEFGIDSAWG